MAELDWHAERTDLEGLAPLDNLGPSEQIDLKAVRQYRLQRVRNEMVSSRLV